MKTFVAWTLMLIVGVLLASPVAAQDATPNPITRVPFVDMHFDIQGVTPQGWKLTAPGVYARSTSKDDVAVLVQQSSPATWPEVLKSLLPQLGRTTAPEPVGTSDTRFATWTLYKVDTSTRGTDVTIDVGLTQVGHTTYVVMLQSARRDYVALHADVFLPALVAFAGAPKGGEEDYIVENVTIKNTDVLLSGTMTRPKTGGPFAAVVLVTGSGPHNRDEVLGNGIPIAPFALLADALTRSGMAVLRYDERGVGQSTGDYGAATLDDFALDAAAAVGYLYARKDINPAQIGVLGHSEGGYVAAKLGAHDPQVAFVILMAAPGVDGRTLLVRQSVRYGQRAGMAQADIDAQLDYLRQVFDLVDDGEFDQLDALVYDHELTQAQALPEVRRVLLGNLNTYARQTADAEMDSYRSGYFKSFLDYDPVADLRMMRVPVLAVYGALDAQVDAAQNASALSLKLSQGENRDFSVSVLPTANHLFQDAVTGAPDEYASLPAQFTSAFVPTLVTWLKGRVTLSGGA